MDAIGVREEREEVVEEEQLSGSHPIPNAAPWQSFCPLLCHMNAFFTRAAISASIGADVLTYVSTFQLALEGG